MSYLSFKPWKSQCGRFVSWWNVALELLMGVVGSLQSSPRSDLKEADESISLIPLWDDSRNPSWEDFDAFLLKLPPMLNVSSTPLSSSEPSMLILWLLVAMMELLGPAWSSSIAVLTPVEMSSSAGLSRSNPLGILMVSPEQLPLRSLEVGSSLKLWRWKLYPIVLCIVGWWGLMNWEWFISKLVMEFQHLFCLTSFFTSFISNFCTL